MDQIDRGVGLEQVAPGPFTDMGLSGDQQHPKPVTDPVDHHGGPVIQLRDLARSRLHRQFDHRRPGVLEDERLPLRASDHRFDGSGGNAVDAETNDRAPILGGCPDRHGVLHLVDDLEALADETVRGRLLDNQPSVPLVRVAGEKHMHGNR